MEGNLPEIYLKGMGDEVGKGTLGQLIDFFSKQRWDMIKKLFQKDRVDINLFNGQKEEAIQRKTRDFLQKLLSGGNDQTNSNVHRQKDKYEVHNNLKEWG